MWALEWPDHVLPGPSGPALNSHPATNLGVLATCQICNTTFYTRSLETLTQHCCYLDDPEITMHPHDIDTAPDAPQPAANAPPEQGRGSLLTCGDVEENPGPPKQPPHHTSPAHLTQADSQPPAPSGRGAALLTCGDVESNPGPRDSGRRGVGPHDKDSNQPTPTHRIGPDPVEDDADCLSAIWDEVYTHADQGPPPPIAPPNAQPAGLHGPPPLQRTDVPEQADTPMPDVSDKLALLMHLADAGMDLTDVNTLAQQLIPEIPETRTLVPAPLLEPAATRDITLPQGTVLPSTSSPARPPAAAPARRPPSKLAKRPIQTAQETNMEDVDLAHPGHPLQVGGDRSNTPRGGRE